MRQRYWSVILMFCFVMTGHAGEDALKPRLVLDRIKVISSHEKLGDELYFDIATFWPDKKQYLQIPEPPNHWPSQQANTIKARTLWSEPLTRNQSVVLIVSLMDFDSNPLNPDDLIGVIRVQLHNKKGVLHARWSIPNRAAGPETIAGKEGDVQKFELFGAHGHYEVYLSLKTH